MPPFAESVSEGDVRWEKKVGDQVKEDDVLCEIETDKVRPIFQALESHEDKMRLCLGRREY